MFSSEQKFIVNGSDKNELAEILKLAVEWQTSGRKTLPEGIVFDTDSASVFFYWSDSPNHVEKLPKFTSPETLTSMVWDFLNSAEVQRAFRATSEADDIDGTVDYGWQVMTPRWDTPGLKESSYAFLVIKPDWIYYHK